MVRGFHRELDEVEEEGFEEEEEEVRVAEEGGYGLRRVAWIRSRGETAYG